MNEAVVPPLPLFQRSNVLSLERFKVLVCWCAPRACHAEVIARAAQWLQRQAP